MNKLERRTRAWLCLLVVAIGCTRGQANMMPDKNGKNGRDNPFAPVTPVATSAAKTQSKRAEDAPPLFLETRILRFLDATSLKPVLDQMVSPYGTAAVNPANNSIVVCDTRESLTRILDEIKKADRSPRPVLVEVAILDVQLKDDKEMGVNWDLLSDERYNLGYRQNLSTSRLTSTAQNDDTKGNATAFNSVGLGGDVSVITGSVRYVVHAVQEKRDVNILANPRTMVISGKMATIKSVEEIPYREITDTGAGGQGALTSTKFKEVGVTLQVAATVTDSNDIVLTVQTEQSVQTGASDAGVPVVDTRKADTSLVLQDGQVVIIGGLRREEKTQQTDQVPLLGDLPLLGFLFKSTHTISTRSELVVLLSPHLYHGEPLPGPMAERFESIHQRDWLLGGKGEDTASPGRRPDPNEAGQAPPAGSLLSAETGPGEQTNGDNGDD